MELIMVILNFRVTKSSSKPKDVLWRQEQKTFILIIIDKQLSS